MKPIAKRVCGVLGVREKTLVCLQLMIAFSPAAAAAAAAAAATVAAATAAAAAAAAAAAQEEDVQPSCWTRQGVLEHGKGLNNGPCQAPQGTVPRVQSALVSARTLPVLCVSHCPLFSVATRQCLGMTRLVPDHEAGPLSRRQSPQLHPWLTSRTHSPWGTQLRWLARHPVEPHHQ